MKHESLFYVQWAYYAYKTSTDDLRIKPAPSRSPIQSNFAGSFGKLRIMPAEFEKDDDTNFHIDFIVATSNLRAENYDIPPADRLKAKGISERIVPLIWYHHSIPTTTSLVAGLIGIELFKLVQGFTDVKTKRNFRDVLSKQQRHYTDMNMSGYVLCDGDRDVMKWKILTLPQKCLSTRFLKQEVEGACFAGKVLKMWRVNSQIKSMPFNPDGWLGGIHHESIIMWTGCSFFSIELLGKNSESGNFSCCSCRSGSVPLTSTLLIQRSTNWKVMFEKIGDEDRFNPSHPHPLHVQKPFTVDQIMPAVMPYLKRGWTVTRNCQSFVTAVIEKVATL